MKTLLLLVAISMLGLVGCNFINPQEELPGFIVIDEFEFQGEYSNSHKITELWVYDEQQLIGVFDVPARIPVLKKGATTFEIFAGIKENGISSNRLIYPFYTSYKTTLHIEELKSDTIVPFFQYKDNVVFPQEMVENFENGFVKYTPFGSSDTSFVITSQENEIFSLDNSHNSGKVVFSPSFALWQVESINTALPSGNDIWAEFNYKSNSDFGGGLRAYLNGSPENLANAFVLKDTKDENGIPQWNKIYVHLSTAAGSNSFATSFSFYLQVAKNINSEELPLVFFDNIKVVHFEE